MNLNLRRFAPTLLMASAILVGGVLDAHGQTTLYTDNFDDMLPSGTTRTLAPNLVDGQFGTPGDVFGIVGNMASFAIADESAGGFPADTLGFADSTKTDLFLGFNDTVNDNNTDPDGKVSVTWTFDVTGQSNLGLSFDVAGMGDFEGTANSSGNPANADTISFTASFDGGTAQEVVFATGDDAGSLLYTLESGTEVTLDDPLLIGLPTGDGGVMNGTVVTNNFQNLSFDIPGSGNTLTLTLTARTDGGSEAFGFDNLVISSGNTGGMIGDFDNDGDVDIDDIDFYQGQIGMAATGSLEQLDLDEDGTITVSDLDMHVTTYVETSNGEVGTFRGDINLDGTVNVLGDAFTLVGNLNNSVSSYADGDLNADGTVNVLGDAFTLVGNLGNSNGTSSAPSTSTVPEPGSISLLAMAAVGLMSRRKRQ